MPEIEYNFNIIKQRGDFTCWAAVAASVSQFYNPNSPFTECNLARLGAPTIPNCCPMIRRGPCDREFLLEDALKRTNNLSSVFGENLRFDEVFRHLGTKQIIAARIKFPQSRGSHFVIIHGCRIKDGQEMISICDPLWTDGEMRLDFFTRSYRQDGRWVETFITQSERPLALGLLKENLSSAVSKSLSKVKRKTIKAILAKKDTKSKRQIVKNDVYLIDSLNKKETSQLIAHRKTLFINKTIKTIEEFSPGQKDSHFIISDKAYFRKFQKVISFLNRNQYKTGKNYSLRILFISDFSEQVFWLHFDKNPDWDMIISFPLSQTQPPKMEKKDAFFVNLKEAFKHQQNRFLKNNYKK